MVCDSLLILECIGPNSECFTYVAQFKTSLETLRVIVNLRNCVIQNALTRLGLVWDNLNDLEWFGMIGNIFYFVWFDMLRNCLA